MNGDE